MKFDFLQDTVSRYKGGVFVREKLTSFDIPADTSPVCVSDIKNTVILPAFCDVHVHFREPGFSYKESIKTGSLAAAHGGYTDVCTMPNLDPVPDCRAALEKQLEIIERDAAVRVHPYGALTVGEKGEALADLSAMAADCCAFSDDGRGVQSEELMSCLLYTSSDGRYSEYLTDIGRVFDSFSADGIIAVPTKTAAYIGKV